MVSHGLWAKGYAVVKASPLPMTVLLTFAPASTVSATKADYHALTHTVVRSRCHMNVCGWFSLESVTLVMQDNKRSLFLLNEKDWSSDYPNGNYNRKRPRSYDGTRQSYAVCSRQDPALIEGSDSDGWSEARLTPGAKDGIFGAMESGLTLYWAACHGINVQDVYAAAKLGAKLGYKTSAPSGPVPENKLKIPTDVMAEK